MRGPATRDSSVRRARKGAANSEIRGERQRCQPRVPERESRCFFVSAKSIGRLPEPRERREPSRTHRKVSSWSRASDRGGRRIFAGRESREGEERRYRVLGYGRCDAGDRARCRRRPRRRRVVRGRRAATWSSSPARIDARICYGTRSSPRYRPGTERSDSARLRSPRVSNVWHGQAADDPGNLSISLPGGKETNEREAFASPPGSPK